VKAEGRLALGRQRFPMAAHGLQQVEGAAHVAGDERTRTLDRAVHVALGRQVHHQVGVGLAHRGGRGLGIGEVHLQQLVAALPIAGEGR